MNCKETREQLELLVLGGLEEPILGRVRLHLDECAACREEEQKLQDLAFDLAGEAGRDGGEASPAFDRLWMAVQPCMQAERRAHRIRMGLFYSLRAAAVVVALTGGVWLYLRGELARAGRHAVVEWRYRDLVGAQSSLPGYPVLRDNWIFAVQGEPGAMKVVAIDKAKGEPAWEMALHTVSALNADDRRVFVLGLDVGRRRGIWALDEASGRVIWHRDRPAAGTVMPDGAHSLVLAGNGVCVVSGASLSFLNRDSGDAVWNRNLGFSGSATVCGTADGRLYVGTGRILSALAAESGEEIWKQPLEGGGLALVRPFIWADSERVVVVRRRALADGAVACFDAGAGQRVWESPVGSPLSAQVADGRIYVKSGALEALDLRTGQALWSAPLDGCSPVAVANGIIYMIGGKEKQDVVSLEADTGRRLWEQRLAGSCSGIVVEGNRGYLRSHDGVLYAITIRDRT